MLSDVFNNLVILNTLLIMLIMLLKDNNIFKKLTIGIIDSSKLMTWFSNWCDWTWGGGGGGGHTSV